MRGENRMIRISKEMHAQYRKLNLTFKLTKFKLSNDVLVIQQFSGSKMADVEYKRIVRICM